MYSTTSDIARFAAALMRGGTSGHGPVLDPVALARMFDAHYRPDPRLPGWGLGFIRAEAGGHLLVGHDGFVPGFNSKFLVAPDDGVGVVAFTNGSKGAFMWLQTELRGCCVTCSAFPTRWCGPTSRTIPRSGRSFAAATGCPLGSPTCAGVWRHPAVSRCSPAAGTW